MPIGAVSPPGGDISEPVSQATLRIVKVFWGLDYALSYARHFPAINWLNSYSLYQTKMDKYLDEHVEASFSKNRIRAMSLLQEEASLQEPGYFGFDRFFDLFKLDEIGLFDVFCAGDAFANGQA